jgi:hypothetical protein
VNTKALNSLADVICRAQTNGKRTPMGIAMAIDSAGRHMSPETAAEMDRLRARVAELEALTPAAIQACRKCGAGYTLGEPCSVCEFQARMAVEASVAPQVAKLRGLLAGQRAALEGEHYAAVHHDYRTSHDLPEAGAR